MLNKYFCEIARISKRNIFAVIEDTDKPKLYDNRRTILKTESLQKSSIHNPKVFIIIVPTWASTLETCVDRGTTRDGENGEESELSNDETRNENQPAKVSGTLANKNARKNAKEHTIVHFGQHTRFIANTQGNYNTMALRKGLRAETGYIVDLQ